MTKFDANFEQVWFLDKSSSSCEETETILDLTNPSKKCLNDLNSSIPCAAPSQTGQQRQIVAKTKLPKASKTSTGISATGTSVITCQTQAVVVSNNMTSTLGSTVKAAGTTFNMASPTYYDEEPLQVDESLEADDYWNHPLLPNSTSCNSLSSIVNTNATSVIDSSNRSKHSASPLSDTGSTHAMTSPPLSGKGLQRNNSATANAQNSATEK